MRVDTLAIVGVGLIGGSIGLAAKARGVARRVVGVGRDGTKLARAVERGALDEFATDLGAGVTAADLVVVCTPVDRVAADIIAAAAAAPPRAVLTDAGSTKADIATQLDGKLPPGGPRFVGSHPLAGSEKTGCEHARADLFDHRVVIVTPMPDTNPTALKSVQDFWTALGARIVSMDPADHDRVLALTSHLPHAAAAAVAAVTPPDWLPLSAGGWRDTTRIAGGDPHLWAAIFRANRAAVLDAAKQFADRMTEFRTLLEADDLPGLVRWLEEAKKVRDALGS